MLSFVLLTLLITSGIVHLGVNVSASSTTKSKKATIKNLNKWFELEEKPRFEKDKQNNPGEFYTAQTADQASHVKKYELKKGNLVIVLSKADKKNLSSKEVLKIAQQAIYAWTSDYPKYDKLASMVKNIEVDGYSTKYVKKANKYVIYK
ncbi:hypothetical protein [Fructobacillus sp. CRL 2054]|uniref:hypothetical protein n=1 Tax=Fructobacillus sp. CRL 2054 TaxID=2763007 RepID=UPI0023798D15|nr:hypothetical protein [Fructobacillus sp. CRL 2054]